VRILVRSPASAATDVSGTSCAVDAVRRSPARNPRSRDRDRPSSPPALRRYAATVAV